MTSFPNSFAMFTVPDHGQCVECVHPWCVEISKGAAA